MKKIVLIISSLLFISAFTGCKQDSDATTDTTPQVVQKIEKLEYTGTGVDGNSKTLSAMICYPIGVEISKGILYCHETKLGSAEIPSNDTTTAQLVSNLYRRYLVVLPDYEGYGSDAASIHPYMNADAAAQQSVEALMAAREHISKTAKFSADYKTVIVGYSQGAQVALASQKYIENKLSSKNAAKINLSESYCGAGPYSLLTTMNEYLTDKTAKISSPTILIYTIMGMIKSYPDIFGETTTYDYINAKLKNIEITSEISGGTKKITEIDKLIVEKLAPETKTVTFNDLFISGFETSSENQLYAKLVQAFAKNDLTSGWKPKNKIRFFHASNDDVVTVKNTQMAYKAFIDAGCSSEIVPEPTYASVTSIAEGQSVHSTYGVSGFFLSVLGI